MSHSSRSFSGGFNVDWDEIDSIAEESLSVASSVSSGHRKRKSSSSRRRATNSVGGSPLDVLEIGSRSRYSNNGVNGVVITGGSRSSGSGRSSQSAKQRQKQKRQSMARRGIQDPKRIAIMGGILLMAIMSIHFCGLFL